MCEIQVDRGNGLVFLAIDTPQLTGHRALPRHTHEVTYRRVRFALGDDRPITKEEVESEP